MDWKQKADQQYDEAEKMRTGIQKVTVVKVIHGKKDGTEFQSKSGDRQMMAVFKNAYDEQAPVMFTLSDKAIWTLAKFMSRAGVDLDKLKADNIDHTHFEDHEFAQAVLMGRTAWAEVEYVQRGDKEYAKLNFMHEEEVPVSVVAQHSQTSPSDPFDPDNDIPF